MAANARYVCFISYQICLTILKAQSNDQTTGEMMV